MNGIITRQQFEQSASSSRKRRLIILLVISITLGVLVLFGYSRAKLSYRQDQTDRVASAFMGKVFANEAGEAYDMTSINFHNTTSQDSFNKAVEVLHGKTPKASFPSKIVSDNLATLSGTIKAKTVNGDDVTLLTIVELVREEDNWRVDSLLVKAPDGSVKTGFNK